MNIEKIGKFIAENRKKMLLTQEELGHKLGVTGKTVSRWENGNYMPDLSLLIPLSQVLNITLNELLLGEKISQNDINKSEESLEATINYSTKTIKKKTKKIFLKIVISLIIIFFISFISYKVYLLHKYDIYQIPEAKQLIDNFHNAQTINVKSKVLNDDEYLILDNIKIRNDFKNYSEVTITNNDPYIIKKWTYIDANSHNGLIISYSPYPFQNLFDAKGELISFNDSTLPKINNKDRISYLYNNNITNELDFFKFLTNKANFKNNIFSRPENIRGSYATLLTAMIFANYQISFLKGDYEGYLFSDKTNNIIDLHILKNNLSYNFIFSGKDFSQAYVEELLNTIVIN